MLMSIEPDQISDTRVPESSTSPTLEGPKSPPAVLKSNPLESPPTIDVEKLLQPIPGENPSGISLAYEPEYSQIQEARRADTALPQGDWVRDVKTSDWPEVVQISTEALAHRTKDLRIAAWLTEALTNLHSFAGLRDGLSIAYGIQERFWETYYPVIEDDDLLSREAPFLHLNGSKTVCLVIQHLNLTDGEKKFDLLRYYESREVDNAARKDPDAAAKLVAKGKIDGKMFDEEVNQTPRSFYERLVADLKAAQSIFQAFNAATDDRFGVDAPGLGNLEEVLNTCARVLEPILKQKREQEPDPELDAILNALTATETPDTPESLDDPSAGSEPSTTAQTPIGSGPAPESNEFGQILIDFLPRARALSELGARLVENREKHRELLSEVRSLDQEYEELSKQYSKNREAYQLLGSLLQIPAWTPPPPTEG